MRGYQKKVIYLKNIGSSVFEEAYFIIKEDKNINSDYTARTELVEEANKIIEENINFVCNKRKSKISKKSVLIFGGGFICSSAILLLIAFIYRIL